MALITAAEARELLPGIQGSGENAQLEAFIRSAGSRIASWLGYEPATLGGQPSIEVVTYTEFLRGPECVEWPSDWQRRLQLPYYPIVSVALIEDDPEEKFDGSTEVVAASDYVLRENEGIVLLKLDSVHGFWSRTDRETIKVTWDAGYSTIPDDIKHATKQLVAFWWKQRGTFGQIQVTIDGMTAEPRDETIPAAVKELLEPYQLLGAILP